MDTRFSEFFSDEVQFSNFSYVHEEMRQAMQQRHEAGGEGELERKDSIQRTPKGPIPTLGSTETS